MLGAAPTGRRASLPGTNVFRVRDGRISEFWPRVDELGLLQQLGLAPRVGA
jgi:predicted ester cyclase